MRAFHGALQALLAVHLGSRSFNSAAVAFNSAAMFFRPFLSRPGRTETECRESRKASRLVCTSSAARTTSGIAAPMWKPVLDVLSFFPSSRDGALSQLFSSLSLLISLIQSRSHTVSLCLTRFLSLSISLVVDLTHLPSNSWSLSYSLPLSLIHSHSSLMLLTHCFSAHLLSLSLVLSAHLLLLSRLARCLSHSLTLSLSLPHSVSQPLTCSLTQQHNISLTRNISLSHRPPSLVVPLIRSLSDFSL